jgi:hypothetical protein
LPKLDQAILAKAFRDELVAQNPNEEPESVPLEGIRAPNRISPTDFKTPKDSGRPSRAQKAEVTMLNRNEVSDTHLTTLLKELGPLTAEALWAASQLDIDDFYDQLKAEEARGLLKEKRGDSTSKSHLLEATE